MSYRYRRAYRPRSYATENKILEFDSVTAMMQHVETAPTSGHFVSWKTRHISESWDWLTGYDGAVELARKGWAEGAERIAKLSGPVIEQIASRIRKPEPAFTDEGASIDMGRFLEGDPECFVQWHETEVEHPAPGKVVHIVVNLAVSAYFTADQFYAKGSAIAILIDCLEHSGRRVTLDVTICESVGSSIQGCVVRLKNADEPVDMANVAYAIAHPAFYRRLGFGVWATLGMPNEAPASAPIKGDITVGHTYLNDTTDAARWAIDELKKQGIVFESEPC